MPLWGRIALVLVLGTTIGFGLAIRDTVFFSFHGKASISGPIPIPIPIPIWLLSLTAFLALETLVLLLPRPRR